MPMTTPTSPLFQSVFDGRLDTFNELIRNGADLYEKTCSDSNVLHAACAYRKPLLVERILELDTSEQLLNERSNFLKTPLIMAIEAKQENIVSMLLKHSVDFTLFDDTTSTLHHLVDDFEDKQAADLLKRINPQKHKIDYYLQDPEGQTLLHLAARGKKVKVLEALRDQQIPIHARNKKGQTALLKIDYGNGEPFLESGIKTLQMLISMGASIQDQLSNQAGPLHQAAINGDLEAAQFLIAHGAPIDQADSRGHRAIFDAIEADSFPMVRFLVEQGADFHSPSLEGLTPLELARDCSEDYGYAHDSYAYLKQVVLAHTEQSELRSTLSLSSTDQNPSNSKNISRL